MFLKIAEFRGKTWASETINQLSQQILECLERGIGLSIEIDQGRIIHISTLNSPKYNPDDTLDYYIAETKIRSNLISCVYLENSTITTMSTGSRINLNIITERDILI